jgi:hypothetical protein
MYLFSSSIWADFSIGGLSYLSTQNGWTMGSVVKFEVVLTGQLSLRRKQNTLISSMF